jgi:hypothetical protein
VLSVLGRPSPSAAPAPLSGPLGGVIGAIAPHVLYDYQFRVMEHWDNAGAGRPGRGPQHGV